MTAGRPPSVRRNFAWNSVGNALYNLAQWVLVLGLSHLTDPAGVGRFSLALAISAPVFLTVGMNLRTAQATDVAQRWTLGDYLVLRHLLNVVAVLVTLGVGTLLGQRGEGLLVLLTLGIAKCVEAVSQTYYGFFQQHERLDLVSRSLLARSITGPLLFLGAEVATGSLVAAGAGLALGWLVPQLVLDRPNVVRLHRDVLGSAPPPLRPVDRPAVWSLARVSAPLGVDAGISSLAINVPRYAVQVVLGAASLGVYAALSYLAQVVSMVTSSMAAVLVPRLARAHHEGRRRAFVRLLGRLTLFGTGVTAVAVLGSLLLGGPFLRLVFPDGYDRPDLLLALLVGAGATTLQRTLCKGIEAARRFRAYVVVDAVTTAAVAACAVPMVSAWGLVGAAWSLTAGFVVGCVAVGVVLLDIVRTMPASPPASVSSS